MKQRVLRELLILGTGVHALEMAEIVERVNRAQPTWNLLGYITLDEKQAGQSLNGAPVLGTMAVLKKYPLAGLVPCNEGGWKTMPDLPRQQLVSLIDPSVFVSRTAQIGAGCVFYPGCYIGLNAKVGDFVFCLGGSVINHDDVVEDGVVLCSAVTLAGSVHVKPDCYLGQSCTIRQFLTIGRHSLIGMGAVVVKNVPPDSVMAGNPARKIRENV